jgi:hypothetical protein
MRVFPREMSEQAKILEALSKASGESGSQLTPAALASMAEAVSKTKGEGAGGGGAVLPDTLTLGRLADGFLVLKALAQQTMDGATAHKIVVLHKWALPYAQRFEKARMAIAEKLGCEKTADGKSYHIGPDKHAEFVKADEPLRAEIVALDPKLKLSLTMMIPLKITPAQLDALGVFLSED